MIIFGTRSLQSNQGQGNFHCPRCSTARVYSHKRLNRWFTLYFIPCIPMGSAGEYIECTSCGGTFGIEAMNYNPDAERAETTSLLRRLCVLAMLHADRFQQENIEALRATLQDVSGDFVQQEEIMQDAQLARQASAQLGPVFQQQASHLSPDGKIYLLQMVRSTLAPNGPVGMTEQHIIEQAGDAIGVPRDVLQQVLTS